MDFEVIELGIGAKGKFSLMGLPDFKDEEKLILFRDMDGHYEMYLLTEKELEEIHASIKNDETMDFEERYNLNHRIFPFCMSINVLSDNGSKYIYLPKEVMLKFDLDEKLICRRISEGRLQMWSPQKYQEYVSNQTYVNNRGSR